jgi:hypothetical protein
MSEHDKREFVLYGPNDEGVGGDRLENHEELEVVPKARAVAAEREANRLAEQGHDLERALSEADSRRVAAELQRDDALFRASIFKREDDRHRREKLAAEQRVQELEREVAREERPREAKRTGALALERRVDTAGAELQGGAAVIPSLERANAVRFGQVAVRRAIGAHELSIGAALVDPRASSMRVFDLLMYQFGWGEDRTMRALRRVSELLWGPVETGPTCLRPLAPHRLVESLSERERAAIVQACGETRRP